jgi:hypothetical protein
MHYAYVGQGVKWDMYLLHLFYQFPDAAGGERAPPRATEMQFITLGE